MYEPFWNDSKELNALTQLEYFASGIIRGGRDWHNVLGGYAAMRKLVEFICCYLQWNYPSNPGRAENVRGNLEPENAYSSLCFEGRNINACLQNNANPNPFKILLIQLHDQSNKAFHYQEWEHFKQRDLSLNDQTSELYADELSGLAKLHDEYKPYYKLAAHLINSFMQNVLTCEIDISEYPSLKELMRVEDSDNELHLNNTLPDTLGEQATLNAKDRWVEYHSSIINRFCMQKRMDLFSIDAVCCCVRRMAERFCCIKLQMAGRQISFSRANKPTLEDYLNKGLNALGDDTYGKSKKERLQFKVLKQSITYIANITNLYSHWYGEFNGKIEGKAYAISDEPKRIRGTVRLLEEPLKTFLFDLSTQPEQTERLLKSISQKNSLRVVYPVALCVILAVALLFFIGQQYLNQRAATILSSKYYADYVWCNGVPVGIFPLTIEEMNDHSTHYEFIYQQGKVIAVEHKNVAGELINETHEDRLNRAAKMELSYVEGTVDIIMFSDAENTRLFAMDYSPNLGSVEYKDPYDLDEVFYLPADVTNIDIYNWSTRNDRNNASAAYSEIKKITITQRNDVGAEETVRFTDGDSIYEDANGVRGYNYSYDNLGRVKEVEYIYDQGSLESVLYPTLHTDAIKDNVELETIDSRVRRRRYYYDGIYLVTRHDILMCGDVCVRNYLYDDNGNCIEVQTQTMTGDPWADSFGVVTGKYEYDEASRLIRISYYNMDDKLVCGGKGFAVIEHSYDELGRLAETRCLNPAGGLIENTDCWALKTVSYVDKTYTLATEMTNDMLSMMGIPVVNQNSLSHEESDFATTEYVQTICYYDREEKLVAPPGSYAKVIMIMANPITYTMFYGENGYACPNEQGVYHEYRKYDKSGNIQCYHYYDAYGAPMYNNEGYAIKHCLYNEQRRITQEQYFDVYNQPATNDQGIFQINYDYNSKGQIVRAEYFDANKEPALDYAYSEYKYDEYGRITAYACFSRGGILGKGKLYTNPNTGVAVTTYTYDERGRLTQYHASDMQLTMHRSYGFASSYIIAHENGTLEYEEYRNEKGELCIPPQLGYAKCTATLNEKGQETAVFYYDATDTLVLNPITQYAYLKAKYDLEGNMLQMSFYGVNNELTVASIGFAHVEQRFNNLGQLTYQAFFGKNMKPLLCEEGYASVMNNYDQQGNILSKQFYDENEQLVVQSPEDYAVVRFEYNEYGQITRESYYDDENKPCTSHLFGCAAIGYTWYGENENDISFYDINGDLILHPEYGYATRQTRYQDDVKIITYLNTLGMPVLNRVLGYAQVRIVYDENTRTGTESFYDAALEAFICPVVGCAQVHYVVDGYGNVFGESYYDTKGNRMLNTISGVAGCRSKFDENGNDLLTMFYDPDNELMISPITGAAVVSSTYDENGKTVLSKYYDPDYELMISSTAGAAIVATCYDTNGIPIHFQYYGCDGKPFMSPKYGCAELSIELDDNGNAILDDGHITFIDIDGNIISTNERMVDVEYIQEIEIELTDEGGGKGVLYTDTFQFPIIHPEKEYCCAFTYYDDRGNCIRERFLDAEMKALVVESKGYSEIEFEWDEGGNLVAWRYYGADGKLMIHSENGFAELRRNLDSSGNVIREEYYGMDGYPIAVEKYGGAIARDIFYDSSNSITTVICYDLDGKAIE